MLTNGCACAAGNAAACQNHTENQQQKKQTKRFFHSVFLLLNARVKIFNTLNPIIAHPLQKINIFLIKSRSEGIALGAETLPIILNAEIRPGLL
jgi:hypothetical protein